MAVQRGLDGLIHIVSVEVGHVTAWSYNESTDEIETTEMGASAKSYVGGLPDGTISIECYWDEADAGQEDIRDALAAGSAVAFTIYPEGGTPTIGDPKISGNVTVNSLEISSSYDGMITAKFGGRGQMTHGTET